jgi:hypothetical protein
MYNTGGDMISGKWTNRLTGETINVRSSVMEGDNMFIITDKGMIDMMDFSQHYIQVSDEVYDNNGNIVSDETFNTTDLVKMESEKINRSVLLSKPLSNVRSVSNTKSEITIETSNINNSNFELIDKVFRKVITEPRINFEIDWFDYPKNKIEMIIDTFDITVDEISDYIYNKYFNKEEILKLINQFIEKGIN